MRFRLLSAHYLPGDLWVPGDKESESEKGPEQGTIIGDDTQYKLDWATYTPTLEMVPLDDEAEAALEKEVLRLQENSRIKQAVIVPIDQLPMFMDEYEKRYIPGFGPKAPKKEA